MPVEKFRDPEDARRALWLPTGDPSIPDRLRALLDLCHQMTPTSSPRGVRKFASIEAAQRERDERVAERVRQLQAERGAEDPCRHVPELAVSAEPEASEPLGEEAWNDWS